MTVREVLKRLGRDGWVVVRTRGDHRQLKHSIGRYLREPKEVFARAYSQYIAVKTQHPALLAGLARDRGDGQVESKSYRKIHQWQDDEFAPIAREFDAMFEKLGWLRRTS